MARSTASVSLALAALALTAAGSIALKSAAQSAPQEALARQATGKIATRLAAQGFTIRIEPHRWQSDIILAARGSCRISARDASAGIAYATAFTQQAATVGTVRYLYRGHSFAAPPEAQTMLFRVIPRSLDRLGVHLARALPVAMAATAGCGDGSFQLGEISVTP